MSTLAFDAFQVYGGSLGVRSFYDFELNYWPQMRSLYEQQAALDAKSPAEMFPEAKTPVEKLNALRADHLKQTLILLSEDLFMKTEIKRNEKMGNMNFLQNYVSSACESPRGTRSVAQVLNSFGVEDVLGFQQTCISQIATVLHKNWNQFYGKHLPTFNREKFKRFFTKRFNRAINEATFQASPSVAFTSANFQTKAAATAAVSTGFAAETFEFEEIAPLEPASTPLACGPPRHNKHLKPKQDEEDDEFSRNLVTWADLYGTSESEMVAIPEFRNRVALHMAEQANSFDNRYTDWLRRQKERVKDRYHKRHPHADSKEGVKEAKRLRKLEKEERKRRPTPPPGGPPGTMPREMMNSGIPPVQSMIEGHYPHHSGDSKSKHSKKYKDYDDSHYGALSKDLFHTDATPDSVAAPPRFVTFEELAKKSAAIPTAAPTSANLIPFSANTSTPASSSATRFLAEFLRTHGHQLAGQNLVFLAPSEKRLQRNSAQFQALQRSSAAQGTLVAAHLFEACDSIRSSTLEPVFQLGRPVVVTSELELVTLQGLGSRLSETVSTHRCDEHDISVLVVEHDSLLTPNSQ